MSVAFEIATAARQLGLHPTGVRRRATAIFQDADKGYPFEAVLRKTLSAVGSSGDPARVSTIRNGNADGPGMMKARVPSRP